MTSPVPSEIATVAHEGTVKLVVQVADTRVIVTLDTDEACELLGGLMAATTAAARQQGFRAVVEPVRTLDIRDLSN